MKKAAISGGGTLPEEVIAYGILPRLPAKTLVRLQCVSKRWRALISTDPYFMRLQDAHARSSPALLLFGETPCPVFLSRREERDRPRSIGFPRIFRQPLFGSPHGDWLPLAACRGILCCALISSSNSISGLYVGNPVWMDWRPLPAPPSWTPRYSAEKMQLAVYDTEGGTLYKLVVPFLTQSGIAGRAEAAFLVFTSTKGSWEISRQKVLLKSLHSRVMPHELDRNVCVEGIFFWRAGGEVLWFDPRDERERGGATPLPFTDVDRPSPEIGEWEGKLSFAKLVDGKIHMWSWDDQSSWSSRILLTVETVARADPDFFASMGLRMNLRNRDTESLDAILNSTPAYITAFGAGFIVLEFRPRGLSFRGICYDAATGRAWRLKRATGNCTGCTRPFAYANSLLKLTTR